MVDAGRITPTDLARRTDMDPAVVTRQVRQLEADGLIRRTRGSTDGRLSSLTPTEEGRDAVCRMRGVLNRHMHLALAGWKQSEVDLLADLMSRLVADLRAIPFPELPRAGAEH
jgi:DNA-binding MarR family transcriptional regulator